MGSPISKKFGDIFIHGKYPSGEVDLVFSSHGDEFTVEKIKEAQAEKLIIKWNDLQIEAERLYEENNGS